MVHAPHRHHHHHHPPGTRSKSRHGQSFHHSRVAQQHQETLDDLPPVIAPKYVHGINSDFAILRQKLVDQLTGGEDIKLSDQNVEKAVQSLSESGQWWFDRLDISDSHVFPQFSPISILNSTLKWSYNYVS